jgi:hypothetical protein
MKKDKLVKQAKEEFGVDLDKKQKLADLEAQVESLSKKAPVKEKKVSSNSKDPIASKSEFGKIVRWNPEHRAEFWTFIYDERSLTEEEKKQLGL